jgi:hypothetical protein
MNQPGLTAHGLEVCETLHHRFLTLRTNRYCECPWMAQKWPLARFGIESMPENLQVGFLISTANSPTGEPNRSDATRLPKRIIGASKYRQLNSERVMAVPIQTNRIGS